MKLTLQTQLLPDPEDAPKIMATVERFNEAAIWLAEIAFERKIANKFELQKLCYAELRERFGLSAQMAIRCIAQVCEAYKRDKGKRPKYRKHSTMPFDQRMISFKGPDRVSLLTYVPHIRRWISPNFSESQFWGGDWGVETTPAAAGRFDGEGSRQRQSRS